MRNFTAKFPIFSEVYDFTHISNFSWGCLDYYKIKTLVTQKDITDNIIKYRNMQILRKIGEGIAILKCDLNSDSTKELLF